MPRNRSQHTASGKVNGLSPLQARFIEEYVIDLNGTAAVRRAGYQTKYPDRIASQLLGNSRVMAAISTLQAARSRRTGITADRVLQEAARVAFLDIRQLYDDDGQLKPVSQWSDEVAAAVSGIETYHVSEMRDGQSVPTGVVKKIHTWSKPSQLKLLAEHLKLIRPDAAPNVVNIQINVRTSLAEALQHAYSTGPAANERASS